MEGNGAAGRPENGGGNGGGRGQQPRQGAWGFGELMQRLGDYTRRFTGLRANPPQQGAGGGPLRGFQQRRRDARAQPRRLTTEQARQMMDDRLRGIRDRGRRRLRRAEGRAVGRDAPSAPVRLPDRERFRRQEVRERQRQHQRVEEEPGDAMDVDVVAGGRRREGQRQDTGVAAGGESGAGGRPRQQQLQPLNAGGHEPRDVLAVHDATANAPDQAAGAAGQQEDADAATGGGEDRDGTGGAAGNEPEDAHGDELGVGGGDREDDVLVDDPQADADARAAGEGVAPQPGADREEPRSGEDVDPLLVGDAEEEDDGRPVDVDLEPASGTRRAGSKMDKTAHFESDSDEEEVAVLAVDVHGREDGTDGTGSLAENENVPDEAREREERAQKRPRLGEGPGVDQLTQRLAEIAVSPSAHEPASAVPAPVGGNGSSSDSDSSSDSSSSNRTSIASEVESAGGEDDVVELVEELVEERRRLMREAVAADVQGRLCPAAVRYEQLIAFEPLNAGAHERLGSLLNDLGMMYNDRGYFVECIESMTDCLEFQTMEADNVRPWILYHRGRAKVECGDLSNDHIGWLKDALADFQEAIALPVNLLKPTDLEAYAEYCEGVINEDAASRIARSWRACIERRETFLPALYPLGLADFSGDVAAPAGPPPFDPPTDVPFDEILRKYSRCSLSCLSASRRPKCFKSKLLLNGSERQRLSHLPATAALAYDALLLARGDDPQAFVSIEHFLACLDVDRRIVEAEHPRRGQYEIPSLADECNALFQWISGHLRFCATDRARRAQLEGILRVVEGRVPNLHMLWQRGSDEPDDEPDEPDSEESDSVDSDDSDSDDEGVDEPLLDIRELFAHSIGEVFTGDQNISDLSHGEKLTHRRFRMTGPLTEQDKIGKVIDLRKTIYTGLRDEFRGIFGEELADVTFEFGYRPGFMRDDAVRILDEDVVTRTQSKIATLRRKSYARLRQKQGDQQYDDHYEAQNESYSNRDSIDTFEQLEDADSPNTAEKVEQYNDNIDFFLHFCLSIQELQQFQSTSNGVAATPYSRVVRKVGKALKIVNKHLRLEPPLRVEQVIGFTRGQYEKQPHKLIATMVDRIFCHLAPGNTCRHRFCNCNFSQRIRYAPEHRDSHADHTPEAMPGGTRKLVAPSDLHNLEEKLVEIRKTLPVSKGCHETGRREDRNYEIPQSRLRRQIWRKRGRTHRTGFEVVTSRMFVLLFLDLISWKVLYADCSLTSEEFECILFLHTGLTWGECTEKPMWVWDECDPNRQYPIVNSILNGVLKRYSERCPNPNCPQSDIVNMSTFGLKAAEWDHEYEEDKDAGVSWLLNKHPIHLINEILRACNVSCCRCHGVKTALNKMGCEGLVFDWVGLTGLDFS